MNSRGWLQNAPCTPHPAHYTVHTKPYTLNPTPCTQHPAHYILHPTPCTLHPIPCTLHSTPYTLHTSPCTLHPAHHTHGPRQGRFRGKRERLKLLQGILPHSQGQNLALTVLYVPYSLAWHVRLQVRSCVVHLVRSTCHAISGRGLVDRSDRHAHPSPCALPVVLSRPKGS